jgi:hypothetical protein
MARGLANNISLEDEEWSILPGAGENLRGLREHNTE